MTARRRVAGDAAIPAAVVLGALAGTARPTAPPPGPALALAVIATLVVVGLVASGRRWWAVTLAAGVVAVVLGGRAQAGLLDPRPGPVASHAVIVGDPRPLGAGVRIDVRLARRRFEATAHGGAARVLDRVAMGDVVHLSGRVVAPTDDERRWFRSRHVVGRLVVDRVAQHRPAGGPLGVATTIRSTLARGASPLGADDRALFLGLVVGDDREQRPEVRDRFRDAGLSHLLAVSGSNVAFVLAVAAPALARLPPATRLIVGLVVLGVFALVTRIEPSVLRATVMAALALGASIGGRPTSSLRLLGAAVAVLVLVDPLLVHSVAFRLSVAASLGIVALGGPLRSALPGPSWVRTPLAITLAAQIGVAPLLVSTFGGVAVASLPANLPAVPAAGPVMVWGATAGLVAGVAPPVAGLVHVPTAVLVGWIDAVARAGAAAPLPTLGPGGVALVAAIVGAVLVLGSPARRARDR